MFSRLTGWRNPVAQKKNLSLEDEDYLSFLKENKELINNIYYIKYGYLSEIDIIKNLIEALKIDLLFKVKKVESKLKNENFRKYFLDLFGEEAYELREKIFIISQIEDLKNSIIGEDEYLKEEYLKQEEEDYLNSLQESLRQEEEEEDYLHSSRNKKYYKERNSKSSASTLEESNYFNYLTADRFDAGAALETQMYLDDINRYQEEEPQPQALDIRHDERPYMEEYLDYVNSNVGQHGDFLSYEDFVYLRENDD